MDFSMTKMYEIKCKIVLSNNLVMENSNLKYAYLVNTAKRQYCKTAILQNGNTAKRQYCKTATHFAVLCILGYDDFKFAVAAIVDYQETLDYLLPSTT